MSKREVLETGCDCVWSSRSPRIINWCANKKGCRDTSALISTAATITAASNPWYMFAEKNVSEVDIIHTHLLLIVSMVSPDDVRSVWERLFSTLQQSDESLEYFRSFFLWWMMSWYPRIFASLSKNAPSVDHFFSKAQKPSFFCDVVCGQRGFSGLHRRGRTFGGLGLKGQPDGSSVRNIFEDSFTEKGTLAGKAIFEGGFKFETSEARKKFKSTYSADQGAIGGQLRRYFWVIREQAIRRLLEIYEK